MMPLDQHVPGCVAIYDSGLGGLSVLKAISKRLPSERLLYYADSYYAPYGDRDPVWINQRVSEVVDFCLRQQAKAIVIACNTVTAIAIESLRSRLSIPVIAIEPGIKVAALQTASGCIGVIGTTATLASERYWSLIDRYACNNIVISQPCPGLVDYIEDNNLEGPEICALLGDFLREMKREKISSLVLACTHYSFVRPQIRKIMGGEVMIVDPVNAVARQLSRVLKSKNLLYVSNSESSGEAGKIMFVTTGNLTIAKAFIKSQLGILNDEQRLTYMSIPKRQNSI